MDENASLGLYQIRLRKGDWELEISAPERDFVINEWERLTTISFSASDTSFNGIAEKNSIVDPVDSNGNLENARNTKPQTLVEFLRQFKFQSNLERTHALGYWCEVKLGCRSFTKDDIQAKYKESKETAPKNIGRDLGILVSKGFLLQDEKSEVYELTNTGIREIEQKLSGQGQ